MKEFIYFFFFFLLLMESTRMYGFFISNHSKDLTFILVEGRKEVRKLLSVCFSS